MEIEGGVISKRRIIEDDRGSIRHIMKSSDAAFTKFGEVYCSTIYPGRVKGWHLHSLMTLNYCVLFGKIRFVLFDGRENSPSFGRIQVVIMSPNNHCSITVPPGVWNGFQGLGQNESFVINMTDIPHDPFEISRMDPHDNNLIDFNWSQVDR